jgi:uncharacterized protein YecE (DUF72 family)
MAARKPAAKAAKSTTAAAKAPAKRASGAAGKTADGAVAGKVAATTTADAKSAAKKAPGTKVAARQVPDIKAPARKTSAAKVLAVKAPAAKAPAKKTTAANAPAKKTTAAKAPAKKTTAAKAPATKATARKPAPTPDARSATAKPAAGAAPTTSTIRVGIGGWTFAPWRGVFYPEDLAQKRELEYASRQLTSIEINGTFYGSQKPESFAKWHDETPENFIFSLKAPRFATHRRILAEAGESIERFIASGVLELKSKLGPINWQFAPTKQFDEQDFDAFLSLLPKESGGRALRHAVEVRHESFRNEAFVALARKHGVAIVMAGDSRYLQIADVTAPFVYARIMGTSDASGQGYDDAALDLWVARMKTWASGGQPAGLETVAKPADAGKGPRDVFLYVISGFKEHNPAAGIALIERLKRG